MLGNLPAFKRRRKKEESRDPQTELVIDRKIMGDCVNFRIPILMAADKKREQLLCIVRGVYTSEILSLLSTLKTHFWLI